MIARILRDDKIENDDIEDEDIEDHYNKLWLWYRQKYLREEIGNAVNNFAALDTVSQGDYAHKG